MVFFTENYLVIDAGSSILKGALYSKSLAGHTLLRLESAPCIFCHEDEEEFSRILKSFIQNQFPGVNSILVLIPAEYVYIRDLKLPVTTESRVKQILPYEVENLLPINLDTAYVTGQIWKTEQDFSYILSLTATYELLLKTIAPLKDSELFFKMITVDSVAIAETIALLPKEEFADRIIAQLHIGAESTILNIIHHGKLSLTRSLPYGGSEITEMIASGLKIPFQDAEEIKIALQINVLGNKRKPKDVILKSLKVPINKYNKIFSEIQTYFVEMAEEVERTILSIPDLRIEVFYISGGSSQFNGLNELLEKYFEIPVNSYPSQILQGSNPALWVPVLGAAIHYSKPGKKRYDFTRTSFGKLLKVTEINWNMLRLPGILSGAAIIILLLSFIFGIVYDKFRIRDSRKEISIIAKRVPGLPQTGNPIQAAQELCNNRSGMGSSGVKFLEIFQNLTESMPGPDRSTFRLIKFNYDTKDVNFEADIDKLSEVSDIEIALKKSILFSSVETQSDLISNKKVRLKIKLKLKSQSSGIVTGCG